MASKIFDRDELMTYRLVGDNGEELDVYSPEGTAELSKLWMKAVWKNRVMYEPTWLGIPIIQYPTDMAMMQELIWKLRPDVIIETGIAHGGSAIFSASILELIGHGKVVAVDVEIRQYNKVAILSHPLSHRINLIEGSSTALETIAEVKRQIGDARKVLVVLDSNHSRQHVMDELRLYGPLVSPGSYMVAMDGVQQYLAEAPGGKHEWVEDNPRTAVLEFVAENSDSWEIDSYYTRMHATCSPDGFLRKLETIA